MPTSLGFARQLEVIDEAAQALAGRAFSAGLDARVPTCPSWRVRHLVAHQGMVHRWASANLRNDTAQVPGVRAILRSVPDDELAGWFRAGADGLLATLRTVDAHVKAMVFLKDAPAPRDFWARRQAHETTIHAVDALAAVIGHAPGAAEAAIDQAVALDGIDELVRGFVPRGRSKLGAGGEFILSVVPADAATGWTVRVTPDKTVTETGTPAVADAVFTGTAAQLYLGLWNRSDEFTASGRPGVRELWREHTRVRW